MIAPGNVEVEGRNKDGEKMAWPYWSGQDGGAVGKHGTCANRGVNREGSNGVLEGSGKWLQARWRLM